MKDTSWVIKAIEDAAMARARTEFQAFQMDHFTFMGFNKEQLCFLIQNFRGKSARSGSHCTVAEMRNILK